MEVRGVSKDLTGSQGLLTTFNRVPFYWPGGFDSARESVVPATHGQQHSLRPPDIISRKSAI